MIEIKTLLLEFWIFSMANSELMIETFEFCDRNSCLHYGCKDILIKDVKIVWQTKDIIIFVADSVDG